MPGGLPAGLNRQPHSEQPKTLKTLLFNPHQSFLLHFWYRLGPSQLNSFSLPQTAIL